MLPKFPVGTQTGTSWPRRIFPRPHHLIIAGEIVNNLRGEATPVDGVGRRKAETRGFQPGVYGVIAEDLLDPVLGVVKIPPDRANPYVFSPLRDHLQALNPAHPFVGIKDENPHPRNIGESFQGRFAGIPGSGH